MTAAGTKMGKSEKGAVWLDGEQTTAFEYFQYWINRDDRDVGVCLRRFTFVPVDEIAELEKRQGEDLYLAKARLAWHTTALCHGREAANKSLATSLLLFDLERYFRFEDVVPEGEVRPQPDIPTASISRAALTEGLAVFKLFVESGLAGSGKQAKGLAQQGGAYV
ncbi:MAG TPA: tyrosine--tRNA ligase, partial [Deltaproteobacteria bacterium]|nr:tyrosine--tRNA ligase [Deltaproteobacteria bacterium]